MSSQLKTNKTIMANGRGGARDNSGAPKLEETKRFTRRIPISVYDELEIKLDKIISPYTKGRPNHKKTN